MSRHYKSVFDDEQELLLALIDLHVDGSTFDCDPMYFKGNFYKRVPRPKLTFDIAPQVLEAKQADARSLPLEDGSLSSMILDPPFMVANHGKQDKFYSSRTHAFYKSNAELTENYRKLIAEAYRLLRKGGTLAFKCQDFTDAKTTFTHVLVHDLAKEIGFYPKDIAILVKPNKVYNGNLNQRHLRKIHTYFWVFIKTPNREDSYVSTD